MNITAIARTCHEANRAYCAALGDLSQKLWEEADQWQRDSAIKGVQFILDNPEAGPSASHESWLEEKRATGWSYGPVKDPEAKTHPCFVPYDELPAEQRAKDYIFGAIVRAGVEVPRVADMLDVSAATRAEFLEQFNYLRGELRRADPRTDEQIVAAEAAAAELRKSDLADLAGEPQDLAGKAAMLDRFAQECFPATDDGKIHFVRAIMEGAATDIRHSLPGVSDELPIARQAPLTAEQVDARSFAARTAHVAAGELYGLMMTENAVRLEDWYGSRLGELDSEIDQLAAFIGAHQIEQAETVWRYGLDEGIILREARVFADLSFARRQAFAVFTQVCAGTIAAIEKVQKATEAELQARKSKAAEAPLKREDSIAEERDDIDELVPYGREVLERQAQDDAASQAKALAELFGGKGDHDGDGKPGGSKPAADPAAVGGQAPLSIGEPVASGPKPNRGGRPKKPKI